MRNRCHMLNLHIQSSHRLCVTTHVHDIIIRSAGEVVRTSGAASDMDDKLVHQSVSDRVVVICIPLLLYYGYQTTDALC